jgi:tetratricopeptide (TPR) repeat protein
MPFRRINEPVAMTVAPPLIKSAEVKPPPSPAIKSPRSPRLKAIIGCYPRPITHTPPPDFGPKCVPEPVARQIDAYFAAHPMHPKKVKKVADESDIPATPPPEPEAEAEPEPTPEPTPPESVDRRFALCLPQNPARFSSMIVPDSNHPSRSILQNPQRIVADGQFAVNEPVKPQVVGLNFDGLKPLRLNARVPNLDAQKTLRDLHLLVQASLRSRNLKDEASAYFNIGLLYESEGQIKRANEFYRKYLRTLGADADPLVFNRIAVNFQLLRMYDDAIEWNTRHLSFSRSVFEVIAANCNIALIYRELGDNAKSIEFYRSALEAALEMDEAEDSPFFDQIEKIRAALKDQLELSSSESKLRDLGSPDLSTRSFGDRLERSDTNRRSIDAQEEYYDSEARISREQGDLSTAYAALISNGKLNAVYGDFERAGQYYADALDVARQIGSAELVNHAKVAIGVVKGNQDLKMFGCFDDSVSPDIGLFSQPMC